MFQETILFHEDGDCPLGSIRLIATVEKAPGVMPQQPMRIFGHYAAVYITRGQGFYSDANGCERTVHAGEIIFIFPELGHLYAPDPGTTWDEIYTVFDGSVFNFWREIGYLNSLNPVRRGPPADQWLARLQSLITMPGHTQDPALRIIRFLELLTEVLGVADATPEMHPQFWVSQACALLATDLDKHLTVETFAQQMGMTADSFRRRFKREVGCSPVEHRRNKQIELACLLLCTTTMTHAKIAQHLGFSDEYHFSRRFRQQMGEAPRQYRQRH